MTSLQALIAALREAKSRFGPLYTPTLDDLVRIAEEAENELALEEYDNTMRRATTMSQPKPIAYDTRPDTNRTEEREMC